MLGVDDSGDPGQPPNCSHRCGEAVFASRFRSGRFRAQPLAAALLHLRDERFTAEWSPAVRAAT
jgi:hypothetical protein